MACCRFVRVCYSVVYTCVWEHPYLTSMYCRSQEAIVGESRVLSIGTATVLLLCIATVLVSSIFGIRIA